MLQKTKGIVLRSVKYGDTSLICSIFTEAYGVQSYHIKGVRSVKSRLQKAGLLQPATILDMVVYHKQQNLQHIREFHAAYIYETLQQEVVKNSVALFSIEILLRLLPEHAPAPELFAFAYEYLYALDKNNVDDVANFPLFFVIQTGRLLGYNIVNNYSLQTPYLHLREGAFSPDPPDETILTAQADNALMSKLIGVIDLEEIKTIPLNASCRNRLLDWYLEFLRQHSQHLGIIRSLDVLRTILH